MVGCRPLSDAEIQEIRQALYTNRDKCLFIIGVKTGLRVGEILSLKISDVFEDGKVKDYVCISRANVKGKTFGREIPLHNDCKIAIENLLQEYRTNKHDKPDLPLFQSRKGNKAISRQQAHNVLKMAYRECGLAGKLGCHSMRKTFGMKIYNLLQGDIVSTQTALGHKSLQSTICYLMPNREKIQNAILA